MIDPRKVLEILANHPQARPIITFVSRWGKETHTTVQRKDK